MSWVRARQLQLLLTHIDRLPESDRKAVQALIRPEDAVRLHEAAALDWVPMKLSVDLAHAVTDALGRERARHFFRDQFASTLHNAVLGSLVTAVTRYLSSDPRPGLRFLSRGHDLLFKDVGRLVVTVANDRPEAILSLVELPEDLARDVVWLDRYAWSAASMQFLWRATTDCELLEALPEANVARFRLWWSDTVGQSRIR